MDTALLVILIIIGNLVLYWIFFGKKKFEEKHGINTTPPIELKPIKQKVKNKKIKAKTKVKKTKGDKS